ncbi:nucleotidyltransferase family protein [Winogradskyella sp. A2]|uniref:nucleotidyltransferase family protein n=1 Tax=Winogradskyella sp. A2 TaxID=3366944 RepID=UPI00398C5CF1
MQTAILILAAGNSKRMGTPKQLLKIGQTTMLGKVINNSLESRANSINVVLGANAKMIIPKLPESVNTMMNEKFENGLSSSINIGVKNLLDFDSILIALGDQPFVNANYFNEMIKVSAKNPDKIVASNYIKYNGVPAIFPKKYYSKLLELSGDQGAKKILNSNFNPVIVLKTPVNLVDVDTPHDYENINKNKLGFK